MSDNSTYTTNIQLEKPSLGSYYGKWNIPINKNYDLIDATLQQIRTNNYGLQYDKNSIPKGSLYLDSNTIPNLFVKTSDGDKRIITADVFPFNIDLWYQLTSGMSTNLHYHTGDPNTYFSVKDPTLAPDTDINKPNYAVPWKLYNDLINGDNSLSKQIVNSRTALATEANTRSMADTSQTTILTTLTNNFNTFKNDIKNDSKTGQLDSLIANFNSFKTDTNTLVNKKANPSGDATQIFKAADPIGLNDAVTKGFADNTYLGIHTTADNATKIVTGDATLGDLDWSGLQDYISSRGLYVYSVDVTTGLLPTGTNYPTHAGLDTSKMQYSNFGTNLINADTYAKPTWTIDFTEWKKKNFPNTDITIVPLLNVSYNMKWLSTIQGNGLQTFTTTISTATVSGNIVTVQLLDIEHHNYSNGGYTMFGKMDGKLTIILGSSDSFVDMKKLTDISSVKYVDNNPWTATHPKLLLTD